MEIVKKKISFNLNELMHRATLYEAWRVSPIFANFHRLVASVIELANFRSILRELYLIKAVLYLKLTAPDTILSKFQPLQFYRTIITLLPNTPQAITVGYLHLLIHSKQLILNYFYGYYEIIMCSIVLWACLRYDLILIPRLNETEMNFFMKY